ncbi:unnamed protein product, partial [Polarella glacialis]
ALHDAKLSPELVERVFEALKPLLRPSNAAATPRVAGPWQTAPSGRFGAPNPRKALGKIFDRLSTTKREQAQALGGEAAQKAAPCSDFVPPCGLCL